MYELGGASRELTVIEKGIHLVKENGIELVIGAGGANIMDCAKLIAFGTYHEDDLWQYVKGQKLKENPEDADARGIILYGAAISTSGRLGLGKEENYAYDIYELEFIPEVLFGASYRRSLTTLFPRFLKAMAKYHDLDIRLYFKDAFGWERVTTFVSFLFTREGPWPEKFISPVLTGDFSLWLPILGCTGTRSGEN